MQIVMRQFLSRSGNPALMYLEYIAPSSNKCAQLKSNIFLLLFLKKQEVFYLAFRIIFCLCCEFPFHCLFFLFRFFNSTGLCCQFVDTGSFQFIWQNLGWKGMYFSICFLPFLTNLLKRVSSEYIKFRHGLNQHARNFMNYILKVPCVSEISPYSLIFIFKYFSGDFTRCCTESLHKSQVCFFNLKITGCPRKKSFSLIWI